MNFKLFLRTFALMILFSIGATHIAIADDDLQNYLNSLSTAPESRAASTQTVVDLSKFESTVRTTPLTVKGLNVKFINGTLSRTEDISGPIIQISGGAKVEFGEGCVISGAGLILSKPLVALEDAYLNNSEGQILAQRNLTIAGELKNLGSEEAIKSPDNKLTVVRTCDEAIQLLDIKSELDINGGKIDASVCSKVANTYGINVYGGDISSIIAKSNINIYGNKELLISYIETSADVIYCNDAATIKDLHLKGDGVLVLCKHLKMDLPVTKGYYTTSIPLGNGMFQNGSLTWCVIDGGVIAKGIEDAYSGLTEEDLAHLIDPYKGEATFLVNGARSGKGYTYALANDNHEVVIRAKDTGISSSKDLQAKLDEIAKSGNYTEKFPCIINIAEEGIVIEDGISIKNNCHAVLTGGKISFSTTTGFHYAFYDSGSNASYSLRFKNITFDCEHRAGMSALFKFKAGTVFIDEGVEFTGNDAPELCELGGDARLEYHSGYFKTTENAIISNGRVWIYGGIIESEAIAIQAPIVFLEGGTIIGGDTVIDCDFFSTQPGVTVKSDHDGAYLVRFTISQEVHGGTFECKGGKFYVANHLLVNTQDILPLLELAKDAYLLMSIDNAGIMDALKMIESATSSDDDKAKAIIYLTKFRKSVISDWTSRTLNEDIVKGISESEFKYLLNFIGIPQGLEIYYNKERKSAQLRKIEVKDPADSDDLQDWLDHLGSDGRGTDDEPVEIPIDEDFTSDGDVNFDDLQAFIDGIGGSDGTKTVTFDGGDWNIGPVSMIHLRNINFTGKGNGGTINVYGTLIIDINITVYRIIRFINVMPGGRVIIRDGSGSVTKTFIYVHPGGYIEYRGGDYTGEHYGFENQGGQFYFYGGRISGNSGGAFTETGGYTVIYDGHIFGGYINYGETVINGGHFHKPLPGGNWPGEWVVDNWPGGKITISGGEYEGGSFRNGGELWFDKDVYGINDIIIRKGGRIYINFKLTVIIRIHIDIVDIVLNEPIILGYGGYRLTENDLEFIKFDLPDGYEWTFDPVQAVIVITKTSGVSEITSDSDNPADIYDLLGRKQESITRGINIVRSKDGKVRKMMGR